MQRVGEFEKVSFEQFREDFQAGGFAHLNKDIDDFVLMSEEEIRLMWESIEIPKRATSGSAGYDFKAPFSFELSPGETIKIPTGIRVKIDDGWWLGCLPRSGLGFKYRLQLNNTMGVIDSDYYFSDNEGHIFAKITNNSNEGKTITVEAGSGFVQAIFIPYGLHTPMMQPASETAVWAPQTARCKRNHT